MNYISDKRHMFVLPKDMKMKQTEERRKFDEFREEVKKCFGDSNKPGVLTLYDVEIINE